MSGPVVLLRRSARGILPQFQVADRQGCHYGRAAEVFLAILILRHLQNPKAAILLTRRSTIARQAGLDRLATVSASLTLLQRSGWISCDTVPGPAKTMLGLRIIILHPVFADPAAPLPPDPDEEQAAIFRALNEEATMLSNALDNLNQTKEA